MKSILFAILFFPLITYSQYCVPTHGKKAVAPIISNVTLGEINNDSGFGLTDFSYSDYSQISTTLSAGSSYELTVKTGDFFPHNIGIWIDYDQNEIFTDDELVDKFEIGGSNPMTKTIEFAVGETALNGTTRLRVRGMLEPFGPWSLSMDPCMPASGEGETEDYTIEITSGITGSIGVLSFKNLTSKIDIQEEEITILLKNFGQISQENVQVGLKIDDNLIYSESIQNIIGPGATYEHTFQDSYDFSNISCVNVSVEINTDMDEDLSDNTATLEICNLSPLTDNAVWYLHSNINGGIEPLGGDPFFSTTNVNTMNNVFSENMWNQAYFETADVDAVFSSSSCVVFLDGSYDHNLALEKLLNDHKSKIENWVASGGKLFINCAIELSSNFFINLGFDNTYLSFYPVSYASVETTHQVFEGPFQPLSEELTGFYYANSVVVGNDLNVIAFETNDIGFFDAPILHIPILAEKLWGQGKVIFGGLAPSQLVEPMIESMNLRANVLDHINMCEIVSSLENQKEIENFKIYPNPASDYIYIANSSLKNSSYEMNLYNVSGQFIKTVTIDKENRIDITDLNPGLYFLSYSQNSSSVKIKFIKL